MERFTLMKSDFPTEWQGYLLDADFHTVLAVIAALNDPELSGAEKLMIARRRLFPADQPPSERVMEAFIWLESCGTPREQGESGAARDFDFEQDAREIYASFRQVYGIDLMQPMHWWAFSALLEGVTAVPCAIWTTAAPRRTRRSSGRSAAPPSRTRSA